MSRPLQLFLYELLIVLEKCEHIPALAKSLVLRIAFEAFLKNRLCLVELSQGHVGSRQRADIDRKPAAEHAGSFEFGRSVFVIAYPTIGSGKTVMGRAFARVILRPDAAELNRFVQILCHAKLILKRYEVPFPFADTIPKCVGFPGVIGCEVGFP